MLKKLLVLILIANSISFAQSINDSSKVYNFHFQQTIIVQGHPSFPAAYSGVNSVNSGNETATSITSTLFFGLRLSRNAEIYFNPELAGGKGISGTVGIAGFPNGEVYRVSNPEPTFSIARLFLRKTFCLGGGSENLEDSPNQMASICDSKRIVITLGKFSLTDIFDDNSYSHDPRSQFLNWALWSSVAWDYPADTKGYTYSIAAEYIQPEFALRAAIAMVPKKANGLEMDTHIKDAFGVVIEFEKSFLLLNRKGISRFLIFQNRARMGSYNEVIDNPIYNLDITKSDEHGRTKTGFAINNEYSLAENIGTFLKYSWNDGKNETWAFTEVDRALSFGVILDSLKLIKNDDNIGLACDINGLSEDHLQYISKGGYGFIIGDGKLNYGMEIIIEVYWKTHLFKYLYLTSDYQFVLNPAYNRDRGPVHLLAIRVHLEF
jgi:high affinity Mn2+ porin